MPSPETSRHNLEKAWANWRRPRPWRSESESQVVRRLTWQWLIGREPRCSGRGLARRLGVSHTYVQKLVREFSADPSKILRQTSRAVRGYGPTSISAIGQLQSPHLRGYSATFEQLKQEQERSRRMRERGWLRSS